MTPAQKGQVDQAVFTELRQLPPKRTVYQKYNFILHFHNIFIKYKFLSFRNVKFVF